MVALGLRSWHAFWTPVKSWAELHQAHNGAALQFFANLATAIGLPILALVVVVTLAFLITDRLDVRRKRGVQNRAMLLGLKLDLQGTRDAVSQNLARSTTGADGRWTALPQTTLEKVLSEAGLLGLTSEQILKLHELRVRILRADGLFVADVDRHGREIQEQFEAIRGLCDDLLSRVQTRANQPLSGQTSGDGERSAVRTMAVSGSPRASVRAREQSNLRQEP